MLTARLLFWVSAFLLLYVYLGYPALMRVWARLRPAPPLRRRIEPSVSVLLVAHDEDPRIAGRIENLLALDYPPHRIEILVASDGSTDGTAMHARGFEGRGVRVLDFRLRRGKAAALNDLAALASGEIFVMADSRQRFDPTALRALVAPFADPEVGAVSGELLLTRNFDGTAVGRGVGFYWRYEKFIRRSESLVDSTVGATGAIYAVRRDLFEPIPPDTVLDDVLIPVRAARKGYRVILEPLARAYDRPAATAGEELARKSRTLAGNFQLFARERWLLDPRRNRLWLQTVSHKALRLACPLFLAVLLGTSIALARSPLFAGVLLGQVLFYAAAAVGLLLRGAPRRIPLITVPYVFCVLNAATVAGFLRFIGGRASGAWETGRVPVEEAARTAAGFDRPAPSSPLSAGRR